MRYNELLKALKSVQTVADELVDGLVDLESVIKPIKKTEALDYELFTYRMEDVYEDLLTIQRTADNINATISHDERLDKIYGIVSTILNMLESGEL